MLDNVHVGRLASLWVRRRYPSALYRCDEDPSPSYKVL